MRGIPLSTAAVAFTPPWYADHATPKLFMIRPAAFTDRAMFEAELAAPPYNAGRVRPWELLDIMADAVRALVEAEHRGQVLEAIAAIRAALFSDDDADEPSPEQRQLLTAMEPALLSGWPDYAAAKGQVQRRAIYLPMLAAQRFLAGWSGLDAPFEAGADGRASDASLRRLAEHDLRAIGGEAYRLMYAEDQRPLSFAPSRSGGTGAASKAGGKAPAARAGRSTARSGPKTPG